MSNLPIGIFDSGIGGLTVANAIYKLMPNEHLIYFGDTAHMPYGDKSSKAIRDYSKEITNFLLSKNCKAIVVACNSASASIGNAYTKWVPQNIPVINVIEPVVEYVAKTKQQTIGLIGTKRTIKSGIFPKHLHQVAPQKNLKSLATPLLAPMIEEGFFNNNISRTIIQAYLENQRLVGIESLVLACTHYPLIEKEIGSILGHKITVHNTAQIVAEKVKEVLHSQILLNEETNLSNQIFYVSDYTQGFEKAAQMFFEKKIKLIEENLWNKKV